MHNFLLSKARWALALALLLSVVATVGIARADCAPGDLSDACSNVYRLNGGPSAISGRSSQDTGAIASADKANIPVAGALFYQDYKAIETQARALLARNAKFRDDISPYQGLNNFDKLIRHFDVNSGFAAAYDDPDPAIITMTLQARIDKADAELRQARDYYAYLAVYADEMRFHNDDGKNPAFPGNDYKNTLCNAKEDPNPIDPQHSGQVLDPVIDWCDFGARLRQSVREAAYLRLVFAQQFMVDALGLHFSADTLIGGEAFVRQEVAKLQAAEYQYELAQKGLAEALGKPLGSGCAVSDFFTQTEWALLSRAASGQQQAQHNIAVRLSYLDINKSEDVPRAQANAQAIYRAAQTDGYLKLIGTAGMSLIDPPGVGCTKGTRPDANLVAEMAVNMLDTAAKAREMRQGRNIFGFDIAFTPARPYHTAFGSTDKGLWEQANEAADLALDIQKQTQNAERDFDLNQQDLMKAVLAINNKVDYDIQKEAGCDRQGFTNDADWYSCVDQMIKHTAECDPMADNFDACINRTTDGLLPKPDCSNCVILVSDMRKARQDLRVAWLAVKGAQLKFDNLLKRSDTETMRKTKVKTQIYTGAQAMSGFEAAMAAANVFADTFSTEGIATTVNYGAIAAIGLKPGELMVQAAHDMEIEDINSDAIVRNFFLDQAEARVDIDNAIQQYNGTLTLYNGVVGQTGHDVFESQREHAYAVSLPANDPGYRMVRDSLRLQLAKQLELAARLSYMAARRAEYEHTARLSGSNFRISDIYKARTANDIKVFLGALDGAIANLPGSVKDAETNQRDLTVSVAQHILGLSDAYLQSKGFTGPDIQTERTRLFRQWVTQHTSTDSNGKQMLSFDFAMSSDPKGLISQIVQQGYDFYWLHKVGGIGQPKPSNNGFGLNLRTAQSGDLGYRQVRVSQGGQVRLSSFAGCSFDYRLVAPAAMLGLDFPNGQPTDVSVGAFSADVNGLHGNGVAGYSTPAFLGRPLASDGWQVVIYAASPDGVLPAMNLQQLTDIEFKISTTYATRANNTPPQRSQCVRADF